MRRDGSAEESVEFVLAQDALITKLEYVPVTKFSAHYSGAGPSHRLLLDACKPEDGTGDDEMLRNVSDIEHDGDVAVERGEEGSQASVLVVVQLTQPQAMQTGQKPLELGCAHFICLRLGGVARNVPLFDDDTWFFRRLLSFIRF